MNILSAIFSGKMGFETASRSMAERADRIAKTNLSNPAADTTSLANDLIGLKKDKSFAEANTTTIRVSDSLLNAFIKESGEK